jgi:molecular chaperone HscB
VTSELSSNHFELFGLPVTYAVAAEALSARYRELQQAVHPDRYASASDQERRLSMQRATQINEAYQVLKDPLRRARYLLHLNGMEWDDEQNTFSDPVFLMEQMERREALGEVRDRDDPLAAVSGILQQVQADIGALTVEIEQAFAADDLESARGRVGRLQFLYKLRAEAEALEADLEDEL